MARCRVKCLGDFTCANRQYVKKRLECCRRGELTTPPTKMVEAVSDLDPLLYDPRQVQVREVVEVGSVKLFVDLLVDSVPGESEF